MKLVANKGPGFHGCRRRRNMDGVVLQCLKQVLDMAGKGGTQHHGRNTDQQQTGQYQKRRGPALPIANLRGQTLMQRIERDPEDQPPEHQAHEWRQDIRTQVNQNRNDSDANQDLGQVLGQYLPILFFV